jgi:hypothetical protein
VHGRIIDRVAGTDLIGLYDVVVLNRGKSQGLDPGVVLAIDMQGEVVPDVYRGGRSIAIGSTSDVTFAPKVKLPNERNGTLLVFKVYDRVSYALVVGADDYIRVGDVVVNP